MTVRVVGADEDGVIALIAARMRQTLEEVLDPERGRAMYSMAWLDGRVRQHLPGGDLDGSALVIGGTGIDGHVLLRPDADDAGPFALIATIFVDPAARRGGLATSLVDHAEQWARRRGLLRIRTYTSEHNAKLIGLLRHRGYAVVLADEEVEMVGLERVLAD